MGQSPSTQVLDYSLYDQKPRQRTSRYDRSPSCSIRTSRAIDVGDIGLLTSAQTLRDPQHRSRDVRSRMRHEENDSDYAFFCMFCDRSFGSNLELEQHLLVHDPAYPLINETTPRPNRLRAASMYSARVGNHTLQPTEPCRVCNKPLTRERLLAHWLLAEAHRNVQGISDLQQTIDRPDLWCALCQTRFTHTDRKRKHMEEMNAHNLHYRELQPQALRDPNFDRSILEVPRITPPSSPPLPSQNVSQNHSLRATSMYCTRTPSPTPHPPAEPCQVCNKPMPSERLVAHWLLAECHRNVRGASDLHQTTDRPELWCALCRTRFTHSDRKRKHMEEMNTHNLRYRELQSQALRDPNFDRSILEVPRATRSASPPASQNHRNIMVNGGEETIPYCAPCDRYFSTEEDLIQHQTEERCGNAAEYELPNPHEDRSSSTLHPPNPPLTMHATRSMPSLPVPSPVVPPVPVLPASISDFGPATTATPSRPSSPPPPSYDETIFQIFTAMESLATPDLHLSSAPTPAEQVQNSRESTSTREAARTPTSVPTVPTPSTFECSLCLEREDNLSSLACGHIFGTECIREALQDDSHCPLCRNEASIKDLRRVFLT